MRVEELLRILVLDRLVTEDRAPRLQRRNARVGELLHPTALGEVLCATGGVLVGSLEATQRRAALGVQLEDLVRHAERLECLLGLRVPARTLRRLLALRTLLALRALGTAGLLDELLVDALELRVVGTLLRGL